MSGGMPKLRPRSIVHEPAKFGLSAANASIVTASVTAIVINVFLAIGEISFFITTENSNCFRNLRRPVLRLDQREQWSSHERRDERHQHHHREDTPRENAQVVSDIQHYKFH